MKINRGIWFSICLFVYFLFPRSPAFSQEGFKLPSDQKRDVIPFELVNNLVIIPVTLNGTRLSFLLDTGVDSTVLFSLDDLDSLALKDSRKVRLRGLGPDGTIDAYLSNNNELKVGEAVDSSHGLFIVLNRDINFSSRMGVPVHGILGYDFFSCFVVDLNYQSGRMIIHSPKYVKERSCRKCKELPLEFYRNKPYIKAGVGTDSALREVLLLVDSGSSDGLWLFDPGELIKE
jgi:hypothetical protein